MNAELIQQAIPCLAVQGVYLREAHFTQSDEFDATLSQEFEFTAQHRAAPESMHLVEIVDSDSYSDSDSDNKHNLMNVRFSCGLRLINPKRIKNNDPGTGMVAEITAIFVAQYLILPETKPSKEALDAFAKSNAGYHIWPYWREHAQSICTKSGLPVVAIPMYRVPKENQARKASPTRKRVKASDKG